MDHFLIAFIDLLHILIFSPFDLHDGSHSLWMYLFTRGFHRVSPPCYCYYILSITVQGIASSCLLYSTPNIALTVACGPDLGHTHSTSPHNWIHPILKTLYYNYRGTNLITRNSKHHNDTLNIHQPRAQKPFVSED